MQHTLTWEQHRTSWLSIRALSLGPQRGTVRTKSRSHLRQSFVRQRAMVLRTNGCLEQSVQSRRAMRSLLRQPHLCWRTVTDRRNQNRFDRYSPPCVARSVARYMVRGVRLRFRSRRCRFYIRRHSRIRSSRGASHARASHVSRPGMGGDPLSVAMDGVPPAERGSLDRRGAAGRMWRRLARHQAGRGVHARVSLWSRHHRLGQRSGVSGVIR